jgi:putative OPT family oligopeptide transporter
VADQEHISTPTGGPHKRVELTVRGIILGALITVLFTAANVYLGLQAGLTFASSIPAAVISMAVLRGFRNSSIFENNIVQTVASAAGTLSSIIFVLPGLLMIGWWTGFPFWQSFTVCAIGGILGVMYSIPLRRALVTQSDLPYPEGVAAAEVLRVGVGSRETAAEAAAEGKAGLAAVLWGAIASAAFAALVATRLFVGEAAKYLRIGNSATGMGFNLQFALLGAGHLVGISIGLANIFGLILAWGVLTPILTAMAPPQPGDVAKFALGVWKHQVRFIGAGSIAAAALWTLAKLAVPVWNGLRSALTAASLRQAGTVLDITEQDIPIGWVAIISAACLIPLAGLINGFIAGGPLQPYSVPIVLGGLVFIVIVGFLVAAVCGYMAGLIGSSNSPVSGLGILGVVAASTLLAVFIKPLVGPAGTQALIALSLFLTSVVFTVATISNDNLQDLKTGQLVGATPWRQQVALILGVIAGAAVIPPILDVLNQAYGFTGAANAGPHALAAPQAVLISTLAKQLLGGQPDWAMLGTGFALGILLITLDETLGLLKLTRLPPLAVALGIYLPAGTISTVAFGAAAGWAYDRWVGKGAKGEMAKRMGVILASGLIVGESLFSVALAAAIALAKTGAIKVADSDFPIGLVGDDFAPIAMPLAVLCFISGTVGLYGWIKGLSDKA